MLIFIRINSVLRFFRLVRSIFFYVLCFLFIILRIFLFYKFLCFFLMLGSLFLSLGVIFGICWLFFFFSGYEKIRVFILILVIILVLVGF